MASSQNGYPVLAPEDVAKWVIPGTQRHFLLRPGHVGFVLAYFILWFHERVERINVQQVWDDWGYAVRTVRGNSTVTSNHSSGTAIDLNATAHPLSVRGTFTQTQMGRIHRKLRVLLFVIRWGGDYKIRADEMHFEIDKPLLQVRVVARTLRATRRGRRIIKANPHYKFKA